MALYTAITPAAGTLCTGVTPTASDTINGNDVNNGAILIVTTTSTLDNVTIVDPLRTPAGNTGTQAAQAVATNTSRAWGPAVLKNFIDPTSGLITVNHSATTGVTVMLVTDAD